MTLTYTSDGWKSRGADPYISLTVHYLTRELNDKRFMLGLMPFHESHTARNINTLLKEKMDEYNLRDTDANVLFVTDNDPKFVAAIRLTPEWTHIPCFAHTDQLVVKDSIKVTHIQYHNIFIDITVSIKK